MIEATSEIHVIPVAGIGEVREGDDLAQLLAPALMEAGISDGDVLCVSTKIVSKALGLVVAPQDRDAAVERSSVRIVARRLHTHRVTTVAQIPSGPVMAAAGVDSSNAPAGPLLLPEDPDACASFLQRALQERLGLHLAVVLTDTSSRVWRVGVGDIALGAAGLRSLEDLRGSTDGSGKTMAVTVRNLADEIAAAADLVKGKSTRVPAALVRGLGHLVVGEAEQVPASALSRTGQDDWFRRPSLESVWQALGLPINQEPVARMSPEPDPERITRAIAIASLPRRPDDRSTAPTASGARAHLIAPDLVEVVPAGTGPQEWAQAGALAERILTALGAESIASPLPPIEVRIVAPGSSPGSAPPRHPGPDAATAPVQSDQEDLP